MLYRRVLVSFFCFKRIWITRAPLKFATPERQCTDVHARFHVQMHIIRFFSILLVRKIQVIINTNRTRIYFIIEFETEQNWFSMLKTVVMTQHMGFIVEKNHQQLNAIAQNNIDLSMSNCCWSNGKTNFSLHCPRFFFSDLTLCHTRTHIHTQHQCQSQNWFIFKWIVSVVHLFLQCLWMTMFCIFMSRTNMLRANYVPRWCHYTLYRWFKCRTFPRLAFVVL